VHLQILQVEKEVKFNSTFLVGGERFGAWERLL